METQEQDKSHELQWAEAEIELACLEYDFANWLWQVKEEKWN